MFGKNRRQSASANNKKPTTPLGGSLASRVGVTKARHIHHQKQTPALTTSSDLRRPPHFLPSASSNRTAAHKRTTATPDSHREPQTQRERQQHTRMPYNKMRPNPSTSSSVRSRQTPAKLLSVEPPVPIVLWPATLRQEQPPPTLRA